MASLCASALHSDVLPVPGGPMCVFSWISVFSHDKCASALHIYVLPVTGGPVCTCVCVCVCVCLTGHEVKSDLSFCLSKQNLRRAESVD